MGGKTLQIKTIIMSESNKENTNENLSNRLNVVETIMIRI